MGISILYLDRGPRFSDAAWFIGLLVSLIILVIVFIVVCFIMARKGGEYPGKIFNSILLKEDVQNISKNVFSILNEYNIISFFYIR